jgi:hypothetical protein
MTARFIVFLMLVVPLQLAWGAVSAYCEHEAEAVADHVGHHVHKHQQDEPNKAVEPADGTKTSNFDFDCGVCHAAGGIALCSGIAALSFDGLSFAFTSAPSFHPTLFSAKPERPKWVGLA